MLTVATLTHPGAVRPTNEDMVLWDESLGLIVVADGLGGHNAGEVASRLAAETVQRSLEAAHSASVGNKAPTAIADRLRAAMLQANRKVFLKSQQDPALAGMGTTLTAAVLDGRQLWFASVGDSRLYTKPAGDLPLRLQTRDDSVVSMLRGSAEVTAVPLVNRQMRHLLTNAIGTKADVSVEVQRVELSDQDIILMTTDGMHGPVGDLVMDTILDGHEHADLQDVAENLLDAAMGSGGRDNITIALGRFSLDD